MGRIVEIFIMKCGYDTYADTRMLVYISVNKSTRNLNQTRHKLNYTLLDTGRLY